MLIEPYHIDSVDRAIIDRVSTDGRISYVELAQHVGVSEATVRNRVHSMVSAGVLKFIGVVDPFKTGLMVLALIGLKTDIRYADEVAQKLSECSEVRFVVACSGVFDIIIEIWADSNEGLLDFVTQRLTPMEGVTEVQIATELKLYKNSFTMNKGEKV